jgi:hypothetical protein
MMKAKLNADRFWLWESETISVSPSGTITLFINSFEQKIPTIELECDYRIQICNENGASNLLTDDLFLTKFGKDVIENELVKQVIKFYNEKPWKLDFQLIDNEEDRFDD